MNLITLSNGIIINLEHVAYISTDGREEGKPDGVHKSYVDGAIIIHFAVPRSMFMTHEYWKEPHMKLKLRGKIADSFLSMMKTQSGVYIEQLSKARKADLKELREDYEPNHKG